MEAGDIGGQREPLTEPNTLTEAVTEKTELKEIISAKKEKDATKVIVQFRAIGNAPILKQKLFKITASQKFQAVNLFLRKELNYAPSEALFLYINSAFAPAPDEIISNLYKSFGTEGFLVVNYCTTAAWG
ncbi:putative autophagy-related protein 12 [Umbelopsis sp. AD052]|nr:putative autophagy-related protein 12 [Umbelopsis sp. AD052]